MPPRRRRSVFLTRQHATEITNELIRLEKLNEFVDAMRTPQAVILQAMLLDNPELCTLKQMCLSPHLSWLFVLNNPQLPWVYKHVTYKSALSIKRECLPKYTDTTARLWGANATVCDFWEMSQTSGQLLNMHIPWRYLLANLDKFWDYHYLSYNTNIPWSYICRNLDKGWEFDGISRHNDVPWVFIARNLHLNWDYEMLSWNANIPWKFIQKHIDQSWDFQALSTRRFVPPSFVARHADKNWDFRALAKNNPGVILCP